MKFSRKKIGYHAVRLILIVLFSWSVNAFSQSTLAEKGITVLTKSYNNSIHLNVIKSFDFDVYRAYNHRQQIQVLGGPLLELYSIKELLTQGKAINSQIVLEKKQRDFSNVTHFTAPKVDIGIATVIGNYPAELEGQMHQKGKREPTTTNKK